MGTESQSVMMKKDLKMALNTKCLYHPEFSCCNLIFNLRIFGEEASWEVIQS